MQNNNSQTTDSHASLIRGSAWMTFGSIFSRILGAIYIIPWYAWMGDHGNIANALTAKSYNIYSLFLIISTAGIPGAVAKQVARYNAVNEYGVGKKLFKSGLGLMVMLGIISAAVMYFLAPILSGGDARQVPVLQSLSIAVLIIPVMSLTRGFFQGYNNMAPSALSQFVEQLARVIWMLLTAFFIMKIQHGNFLDAVVQSNLAAAIGAVFGLLLLVYFYKKKQPAIDELVLNSNNEIKVSTKRLLAEIVQQSIPFIIIDSGITFFQLIDQFTFNPFIKPFVNASFDQIESWYALFGLNANKLIMIIVSLATAMAVTSIPLLAGAHAKHDERDIAKQIESTIELFLFVMLPSSLGMAAIAKPIYTIFYGYDSTGVSVLYLSAFVAILLGLFTVVVAIMQGLSENGLAIKYLALGIILKFALQFPAVYLFKLYGPLLATAVGMGVTCWLALYHMKVAFHYNQPRLERRFIGIAGFSLLMFLAVSGTLKLLYIWFADTSRMQAVVAIVLALIVGVVVYGFCVVKTDLAQKILGQRVNGLLRRLHIKM